MSEDRSPRGKFEELYRLSGMNETGYAGAIGVSPAHVNMILRGKRQPSDGLLEKCERFVKQRKNSSEPATDNSTHQAFSEEVLRRLKKIPGERRVYVINMIRHLLKGMSK
jgi:helix-turn-helix protein